MNTKISVLILSIVGLLVLGAAYVCSLFNCRFACLTEKTGEYLCLDRVCVQQKKVVEKRKKYHKKGVLHQFMIEVPREPGSADVICRRGSLMIRPGAKAILLVAHGYMCTKDDVAFLRALFQDYHVCTFDFRAHGDHTNNQCSTFGVYEQLELQSIAQYLRNHPQLQHVPLIIYGFSMGAVTTLLTQEQYPSLADALILDCPFESTDMLIHRLVEDMKISVEGTNYALPGTMVLKKYLYYQPVQSFFKAALKAITHTGTNDIKTCMLPANPLLNADKITIPTLFIACKADKRAPAYAVRALYDRVQGYKRLWITDGRCHFDSFFYNPEKYTYKITKFIEDFISGAYKTKAQKKIVIDHDHIDGAEWK